MRLVHKNWRFVSAVALCFWSWINAAKASDPKILPVVLKDFDVQSKSPDDLPTVQKLLPRPKLSYEHLHDAIWRGGAALAARLTNGADPNLSDKGTPILFYAMGKDRESLEELLMAGADPNRKSATGSTALHSAIWRNDSEAAELLLNYGANPDLIESNQSAIEYAKATRPEWVEMLQRKREVLKPSPFVAPNVLRIPDSVFGSSKFRPPAGGEAIVFTKDSRQVIIGDSEGNLRFFDMNSGSVTNVTAAHERQIDELARVGASNVIVSSGNNEVRFWDAETCQELMRLKSSGRGLSVSPDGRWLFTGSVLWEIESASPLRLSDQGRRYPQSDTRVYISWSFFTPDSRFLIFGVQNGFVYIWNLQTDFVRRVGDLQCEQMKKLTWGDLSRFVDTSDADPDALLVLATNQYTILTGSASELRAFQSVVSTDGFEGRSLAVSPNGQYLASYGHSSRIDLYDLENKCERVPLEGHTEALQAVAASPDGRLVASGGDDKTVRVWDRQTRMQVGIYETQSYIYSLGFSPDGQRLVAGDNQGNVYIYELSSGHIVTGNAGGRVTDVRFSSDGSELVVLGDQLQLLNARNAKLISQVASEAASQGRIAVTPDNSIVGSVLRSDASQTLMVPMAWSFENRELRLRDDLFTREMGHRGMIGCVAISKDGTLLASESSGAICLWDLQAQKTVGKKMAGHIYPGLSDLEFSHDGKWLASAGWDGIVQVWELATGRCALTLDADVHRVSSLSFFPDGGLVTGNWDGTIHYWDLPRHLHSD